MNAALLAAFTLGLMGSGHCLGMCGGIISALSFAQSNNSKRLLLTLCYHFGRIVTYGILGGLAAAFANHIPSSGLPIARTLAGIVLILLGLHFLGVHRGIVWLERVGHIVWRWLKPVASALMPVNHPFKAILAGAVWGWLPCGLVYAALAYAAAQTSFMSGGLVMLGFGLGTLPALVLGSLAAGTLKQWLNNHSVRLVIACAYIIFGLWTLGFAWYHVLAHDHSSIHSSLHSSMEPNEHHHHHQP